MITVTRCSWDVGSLWESGSSPPPQLLCPVRQTAEIRGVGDARDLTVAPRPVDLDMQLGDLLGQTVLADLRILQILEHLVDRRPELPDLIGPARFKTHCEVPVQ